MCSSASATSTSRKRTTNTNLRMNSPIFVLVCCSCITLAAAFSSPASSKLVSTRSQPQHVITSPQRTHARTTALQNSSDDDDEDADLENYDPSVAAQIRKARKLLRDTKKKMEIEQQQQQQSDESSSTESAPTAALPFFAQKSFTATAIDHTQKIKSKTKSGEIIADGDTMTSLSNSEPWELRSLTDIGFESEARSDFDGNLVEVEANGEVKKTIAERDLAASIYNLRKVLKTEDFRRVFDSRNRFIGEVD
eukprot:scaffold7649_cov154-Skeletonema_marinoi.AAC.10